MMALTQNKYGFVQELYEQSRGSHLSSDEALKLVKLYKKEKDESKKDSLRDKIVTTHVKLILGLATRASKVSSVPVNDLFQNGIMGLLVALDKFNVSRKFKFSTYATPWIRKHIQLSMADSMDIRIIPQLRTNCRRYLDIKAEGGNQADAIRTKVRSKKLGSVSSLETASRLFFDREAFVSLQAPVGDENSDPLEAILADGRTVRVESDGDRSVLMQEILSAVMKLRDKERQVILEKYFDNNGNDVTRNVISKSMSISNEGVRQIEIRAIDNLRRMLAER